MLAIAGRHARHSARRAKTTQRQLLPGAHVTMRDSVMYRQQQQQQQQQQRSFTAGRALTGYWMRRAKIVQIVWRSVMAYPSLREIHEPESPLNKVFAPATSERERAFMFILSHVPSDEPVDLVDFVHGASGAVERVYQALYDPKDQDLHGLKLMATPECVEFWKQQRKSKATLEQLEIKQIGVSEFNYSYSNATDEEVDKDNENQMNKMKAVDKQEATAHTVAANGDAEAPSDVDQDQDESDKRPYSKFLMYEHVQVKVQLDVREHLRSVDEKKTTPLTVVDSQFEWTFETDVSRADLMDWVITAVTPIEKTAKPDDTKKDDKESVKEEDAEDAEEKEESNTKP